MDITKLKNLWESEKKHYESTEVGSGVQKFVKEVFKSPDIFNLKEGKLSTSIDKRNYEFIEEAKKNKHRADVVIFIDSEIIIPVEIERFGNIEAGIKQVFQYQTDWQKKLGLLTDGYQWIFYNNQYQEQVFYVDAILNQTDSFLAFWQEYIKPETYYLSFFEKKGQLELFEFGPPNVDDVRTDFFFDITTLIKSFQSKLKLKGYFQEITSETEKEKKAVEITYAYLIQFILYKTLVDNAFADFEQDWIDRLQSVDKALKAEIYGEILHKITAISDKISDKIYKRFSDEQLVINDRLKEILQKPKQDVNDVSVWLDILLFISRYDFANVQNEIFGYIYENYLKDLYLDEKKGQYFTDPHVVDFMLTEMGYNKDELQKRYKDDKDSISIIDPACGSGTFLYNATARLVEAFFDSTNKSAKLTEKIINNNIFGLDIAEFPLYLAEMNILMRMLPIIINENYNNPQEQKIKVFKTRDSISEFLDTSIRNTLTDINQEHKKKGFAQLSMFAQALELGYDSFMRDKGDLDELKKSLEMRSKIPRFRFDFVVGNPPYVSYNECASQKVLIFELMKEDMIKLNDIYGINLHSTEDNPKKYRPNPNLYAFFICLGIALLKDDGILSFIIPQTMLTSNDNDVLRYYLSNFLTIEKIITFSGKMFIGRGILQNKPIATSSLIFVVKKNPPKKWNKVKITNIFHKTENILEIFNVNKKTDIRKETHDILQTQLLSNIDNWNFITKSDKEIDLCQKYIRNTDSFDIYRLFENSVPRFNDKFFFDVGFILDKNEYTDKISDKEHFEILDFKQFIGFSNYVPKLYYPDDFDKIVLTRSNQGHQTLSPEYSIVWRIKNHNGFFITNRKIIFNMGVASIITSNNRDEMYYLVSILNSKLSKKILEIYLKIPSEKEFQVAILPIKKFIRVPIINNKNELYKHEIIKFTSQIIDSERKLLSDIVNFSNLLFQKFDKLYIDGKNLVLEYRGKTAKCKITGDPKLVEKCIAVYLNSELFATVGSVNELKQLSAFDVDYQAEIKDYIDDLVFSLYFKIDIPELGFENRNQIKELCKKNKYYKLIDEKQ